MTERIFIHKELTDDEQKWVADATTIQMKGKNKTSNYKYERRRTVEDGMKKKDNELSKIEGKMKTMNYEEWKEK